MQALNINSILKSSKLQYKIEKVLGQGSFGITYLASTTIKVEGPLGSIDTPIKVAIKEFFMRDINGREEGTVTCSNQNGLYDRYKEKFIKEAQNLSKLKHRHIIKVLEVFEANNTYYYVMEFCEGGSLDDEISKRGKLSEDETQRYAIQIAEALDYMHENKMLHLDLKPGNAMLRSNGDVVLIDFGLSKQYDENGQPESSTTIGGGTPGYAPLEQSNYDGKGFPNTMDIYALGGTMFKMLTGKRPPEASIILNCGFPSDELRQQGVSEQTIGCIERSMSFRVADRPQSIAEFIEILDGKGLRSQSLKDAKSQSADDEETELYDCGEKQTGERIIITYYPDAYYAGNKGYEMNITSDGISVGGITLDSEKKRSKVYLEFEEPSYYKVVCKKICGFALNHGLLVNSELYRTDYFVELPSPSVYVKVYNKDGNIDDEKSYPICEGSLREQFNEEILRLVPALGDFYDSLFHYAQTDSTSDDEDDATKYDSTVKPKDNEIFNGHECVDLGLPSGLKWATCNVGANSAEEYGNYYGWGEVKIKSAYKEDLCKSLDYCSDISDNVYYDASKAEWGVGWRLPTENEYKELLEYCRFYTRNQNDKKFLLAVGPNGNEIIFPIAGYYEDRSHNSSCALYWSSVPKLDKKASCLYLGTDKTVCINMLPRHYGACIRPVYGQKGTVSEVDEKMLKRESRKGYWFVVWFIALITTLILRLLM